MSSMFEKYRRLSSYDEMLDSQKKVRPEWQKLVGSLKNMGLESLIAKQKEIDWRLEYNGVTYNAYNDPEGINRPWKLDPIPMLVSEEEWSAVEAGLGQRSRLLNLIFQDIYSDQKILTEGILPMEVVYAHSGFLREMHGLGGELVMHAVDMARGPDGKFWVIGDRTQAPSGLGYAIENRLTMNAAMHELYDGISVKRLYHFIEMFKSLFEGERGDDKLNVLLTPGPHNETYFEHAYLSSFLGLTLVQGQDLLAKNGALWLKSLKGLRRIDTILRRVDETYCDPLELRPESQLGVAGFVQAIRRGGVRVVNPLGSGVLENLGLTPFLPELARYFLGEELLLPQIATWWCGQPNEKNYVLENLENLIVKTIDRTEEKGTYVGQKMSEKERNILRKRIREQPYRYVGQEEVAFATIPTLVKEKIQPGKAVVRAYTILHEGEASVMPGALVRVGIGDDSSIHSGQFGGSSKDLWVFGESGEVPFINFFKPKGGYENALESIPSMRAENLFWLGRYLTRSILTARMIRMTLKYVTNLSRHDQNANRKTQEVLTKGLTHLTMTYPGFLNDSEPVLFFDEIWSVLSSRDRIGSLAQTVSMLAEGNSVIRNLLPMEAWRIFERMIREWEQFCKGEKPLARMMIHNLDKLLMQLMAYKELIQETLFTEQGLLLYEIGACIERSQLLISKTRAMLIPVYDPVSEYEILEGFLSSCESLNAYRARYHSSFEQCNVIEFALLDIHFPKSLISEIDALMKMLPLLPKFRNATYLNRYEEPVFEAFSRLRLSKIDTLCSLKQGEYVRRELEPLLSDLSEWLILTSNELSKTYFAHYDE